MHESFILLGKYYFLFIFSLACFFSIGHYLLKFTSGLLNITGFYTNMFIKSLTGLTASVILYSIIATSFKTINLVLLIVIAFLIIELLIYKRKHKAPIYLRSFDVQEELSVSNLLKKTIPLFIISLFIYGWFALLILKFHAGFPYIMNCNDKVLYSNLSMMLDITGQENRWGIQNILNPDYHGIEPYHYFELWLNAMFSSLYRSLNFISLYLLSYPLTNFMIVVGLLAIGESPMEFLGERFTLYYLFLILSFLFYLHGYSAIALTSILLIPITSVGTLPGIIGGLALFLIVAVVLRKITKHEFLRVGLYIILVLVSMSLLYKYLGNSLMSPYFNRSMFSYTDINVVNFRSVKIFLIELIYRVTGLSFQSLFFYAPFIIIALFVFFKRDSRVPFRGLFCLSFFVWFCSLIAYGTFYKFCDGIQFYTNNFTFMHVLLTLALIVFFFEESKHINKSMQTIKSGVLICFLAVLLLKMFYAIQTYKEHIADNNVYTDSYLLEIQKINKTQKEKSLVAALCVKEKSNLDKTTISCPYLVYMPQFYPCINISVFDVKDWDHLEPIAETQKAAVELSVFSQFIQKQKAVNSFVGIDQSQVDFITQYNIHFIIVSKGARLSELLASKINRTILDSLSGERFMILK